MAPVYGWKVTARRLDGRVLEVSRRIHRRDDAERLAARLIARGDVGSVAVEAEAAPVVASIPRRSYR